MPRLDRKPSSPLLVTIASIGVLIVGSAIAYFSSFGTPVGRQTRENSQLAQPTTTPPALQMGEVKKIVQKGFDNRQQTGSGDREYEIESFSSFQEHLFESNGESFKFVLAIVKLKDPERPQNSGVRIGSSLPVVPIGLYQAKGGYWTIVDAFILYSAHKTDTISAKLIKIGPDKQGLLVSRQNDPSENPLLVSRFDQQLVYVHDNRLQRVSTVNSENNDANYGCLTPGTPANQAAERIHYPCFHYGSSLEFSSTTLSVGYYDFTVTYAGTGLNYEQLNEIVPMNYSTTYSFDPTNGSYRHK